MAITKPKTTTKKKPAAGKKTVKKFITPVFRASFPKLFEAEAMEEGQEKKFSIAAIWDKLKFTPDDKAKWSAIIKEMDAQCQKAFSKPWAKLPGNYKKGIRHGSEKDGMDGYQGEGIRFANLTSKNRPGVIDREKNEISVDEGNTDLIYPGCYCRATITIYTYDKNGGKGVALGLRNVQFVKNGPRLDNRTDADEDFDDEIDDAYLDDEDEDGDEDGDDFEGDDD